MEPRNGQVAGAETVEIVERNMSKADMRGTAILPGSIRARHAQKECIGSWEVPRLTSGNVTPWPASGRRGAEADDARTWEVGHCRKSCEAGEQGGAIRCGVGGAKGGDQGECGSAKHAPGSGTGKCVTGAGTNTASCEAKEE